MYFLLESILKYLFPWEIRYISMTCKLPSIENMEKSFVTNHRGSIYSTMCHIESCLLLNSRFMNQVEHECHEQCNATKCNQNNSVNDPPLHWDWTKRFTPYKCAYCGTVYVSQSTCQYRYYLTLKELRCLDTYGKYYRLTDVRWLSLVINKTLSPRFRNTKARLKRELWIEQVSCSIEYDWIDVSKIFQMSHCFFVFRTKTSTLSELRNIMTRFDNLIHLFKANYDDLTMYDTELKLFPDMRKLCVNDPYFEEAYERSIEKCVDIALYGDQRMALRKMRRIAFDCLKKKYVFLQNCHSLHTVFNDIYKSFLDGYLPLYFFMKRIEYETKYQERKRELVEYLHECGIFAEVIKCDVFESFIAMKKDNLEMQDVLDCIIRHHIPPYQRVACNSI
jgi:hypothetical protein